MSVMMSNKGGKMKHKVIAILLAVFFFVGIVGCGGYYMVKDPASDNVYYTKKIKDERGGAIKFKDEKTQTNVTLQNSEIKQIPKKEFKSALEAKEATEMKEAPESKPVKE
jgi:hypothetical protein